MLFASSEKAVHICVTVEDQSILIPLGTHCTEADTQMFEGNAISGTVDFARISPWQKYNWANGKIIFFWWTCKAILFSEKRMSSSKLTQNQETLAHLKCWNTVHAFWDKCSLFKSCGIWKIIVRGNEAFPEEASYKPRNSGKALLTSSKPSSSGLFRLRPGLNWSK